MNFCQYIVHIVLPPLEVYIENRKIKTDSILSEKIEVSYDIKQRELKDNEQLIKRLYENNDRNMDRKKTIEDKAKSLLIVLTVSATLVATISGNLYKMNGFTITSKVALIISLLYFVFATVSTVKTLMVDAYAHIDHTEHLIYRNNTLHEDAQFKELEITTLYKYIIFNERKIQIKTNNYISALLCLRNAVIMLFIYFGLYLFKLPDLINFCLCKFMDNIQWICL